MTNKLPASNAKALTLLLVFLILSVLVFFTLAADVAAHGVTTAFDHSVSVPIQALTQPALTKLALLLTWFGSGKAIIIFALAVSAALFFCKRIRDSVFILLATTSGVGLAELTKLYFHRARPINSLITESGYSFPSAHTALSTCLYGAIIIIIWRQNRPLWLRLVLTALLSLLVMLIGLSRIYLGVHYPTDVLGGFFLGLFCLSSCLFAYFMTKKQVD